MKIRMTQTVRGSLNGVTVQDLLEGQEYETVDSPRGERLARYHIKQGVAVDAAEPVAKVGPSDDAPAQAAVEKLPAPATESKRNRKWTP